MSEASSFPRRAKSTRREPTANEVRALIAAKLQKAGAKGTAALIPAKGPRALYEAALESMEAAEEVFIDRRKAKPKYFAWASRPLLPTVESVAEELATLAAQRFPVLASAVDFKKLLPKDQAALLADALAQLIAQQRLVSFIHASGKKKTPLFVAAMRLREQLGGGAQAADFPAAYADLVRRTGFPAVLLSELQRASGVDLAALHRWARAEHQAGRVVLSVGDWSLATEAQRAAMLELHGERYLQVRLLA